MCLLFNTSTQLCWDIFLLAILEDSTILKKTQSQIEEVNMDNVFEQVSEYLSNKNLNEVIMKCEAYLQADAEVDKLHDKLKGMQLSQETKETVDEFLDLYMIRGLH